MNCTVLDQNSVMTNLTVYLSANDQVPRVLYKQVPIVYLLLGAVFNIILLYYLIAARKYRSPVFMLVTSLAISDFLTCLSGAGWAAFLWPYMSIHEGSYALCKIIYYTSTVSLISSGQHLVLFAAIRYYQLCHPLRARLKVTSNFVRYWCLVIWGLVSAAFIVYLVMYNTHNGIYRDHVVIMCEFDGLAVARDTVYLIINTIYTTSAIFVLHIAKFIRLRLAKTSLNVGHQCNRKNTDARAMTIIIVLFYISFLPANIYRFAQGSTPGLHWHQDKIYLVLMYVMFSNSTVNPIIYCLAADSVRRDIRKFLFRK